MKAKLKPPSKLDAALTAPVLEMIVRLDTRTHSVSLWFAGGAVDFQTAHTMLHGASLLLRDQEIKAAQDAARAAQATPTESAALPDDAEKYNPIQSDDKIVQLIGGVDPDEPVFVTADWMVSGAVANKNEAYPVLLIGDKRINLRDRVNPDRESATRVGVAVARRLGYKSVEARYEGEPTQ